MRHFSRHADTFTTRRMRVNRLANIHSVSTHLNRQSHFANHVACVGADHAATQDLAMAMRFIRIIEQELGHAFVSAIGDGAA